MSKLVWIISIVLIIALIISGIFLFGNFDGCEINEIRETPVSLELAKAVAQDNVERANPPFEWVYVDGYIVDNSFGESNYYVIIFRKKDFTTFSSLEQLEQNAEQFSSSTSDESDKKYLFNDIATVITGAMKEDKLIQRSFRGIPEANGKKLEIKDFVESNYPGKTIGKLIADSPSGSSYYEIVFNSGEPTGDLISVYDLRIVSIESLRENQESIEERKQETYNKYSRDECEYYQQAFEERIMDNLAQWNNFA